MTATIYSLPSCPWCVRAKALLEATGIEYEEILQKHPDWPTVPYILLNGDPVGGFTDLARRLRSA
jgi:glutaredoxin 3